jgi:hypothetical protein
MSTSVFHLLQLAFSRRLLDAYEKTVPELIAAISLHLLTTHYEKIGVWDSGISRDLSIEKITGKVSCCFGIELKEEICIDRIKVWEREGTKIGRLVRFN